MSALTDLAPAVKPASNFCSSGIRQPPTKPTLPVLLFSAAAAPTRKEPSCSAKVRPVTLGAPSTTESMIANWVFG